MAAWLSSDELDRLSAQARLTVTYETVTLGDTTWGPPASLVLCFGSFVVYWLIFFGSFWTPVPSPSALAVIKRWHNYALAAYSAFCCGFTVWWLLSHGHTSFNTFMCERMDGDGAELVTTTFTLSKLWEWGDTVLLVWGSRSSGRQWQWTNKTVLHCFHHSTTFWLFLMVSNFPCAVKTGTLLNGGVHTVMYFYYANPAAFPKRWTPLITQAQIVQLLIVTQLWIITPYVCAEYESFPAERFAEYVTGQIFVPTYILMFISFYFKRFQQKVDKPAKSGKAE